MRAQTATNSIARNEGEKIRATFNLYNYNYSFAITIALHNNRRSLHRYCICKGAVVFAQFFQYGGGSQKKTIRFFKSLKRLFFRKKRHKSFLQVVF